MLIDSLGLTAPHDSHLLHESGRIWEETNCYLDVLIELLHAFGEEPLAALGPTLSTRWESDQWTFCKFNDEDLRNLFGIDIQEINPWKDLHDHVLSQLAQGHVVLMEADAFHLPDTRGASYQREHVKTTIGVVALDPLAKHMVYFHGRSRFELTGNDYTGIWKLDARQKGNLLPPYLERMRKIPLERQCSIEDIAVEILTRELKRLPDENPVSAFSDYLEAHLVFMREEFDLERFHQFSFATFRQIGACFELLASHLTWLQNRNAIVQSQAPLQFMALSKGIRTYQFQFARAISRKRVLEVDPIRNLGAHWRVGVLELRTALGA